MPADGPAMLGAGAFAGMVMIVFGSQIIHTNGLAPASTLTHRERERERERDSVYRPF